MATAVGCSTKVCSCSESMSNTGTDCMPVMQVAKKLLLTPVFDSTGVRNSLNLAATINAATFTALINQTDSSKRIYPLPELKNIADTRNDPIVETFDDNSTMFLGEGIRNFEGFIVNPFATPVLKAKLKAVVCQEMGVYIVDRNGALRGIISDDGTKLYPYRLDSGSFSAQFINPTNTTSAKIQIRFAFHADEDDGCQRMLIPDEMNDASLLLLKGLIDVYAEYDTPTVTGVVATLKTEFGSAKTPTLVKGLVVGDFAAYNVTQSSAIALTGVGSAFSESDGVYTFTYATADQPSVSDVIRLTPTKNGFDFTQVVADTFVTA